LKLRFSTFRLESLKIRSVLPFISLFGLILHFNSLTAQPSITLQKGRETGILAGLAAHSLINLKLESDKAVSNIRYWKISGIDKTAPLYFSPKFARASDITSVSAGLLTLYGLSQNSPSNRNASGMLLMQNLWLTYNITHTTKILSSRARPYANEKGFRPGEKDDAYSFFSGHTSLTACMAASHYFHDRTLPMKDRRPAITLGLSALSIGTGLLRIKSGKHFPTDVLAGAIIGTGVAYLNTRLHAR
jgi:membrane-associated phospholipid phosphatase